MAGFGQMLGNVGNWIGGLFRGGRGFGGSGQPFQSLGGGISVPQGQSNFLNPMQLRQQNFANQGGGGIASNIFNLFKSNPSIIGGLGTMLGSQAIRSPRVPQLPQSAVDFQNVARQGTPEFNLASQRLTEGLNQPFQQVSADEEAAATHDLDVSRQEEMRQLTGMYKSLRPGSDPLTDTTWQRDQGLLNDRYARARAQTIGQLHRQVYNDFQAQQATRIAQAMGLNQEHLNALSQMSQLDLDRQLAQFQISDRDRELLRNYILQLGGNVAEMGIQKNLYPAGQLFNPYTNR